MNKAIFSFSGTNSAEGIMFSYMQVLFPSYLDSYGNDTVWEAEAPCFLFGRDCSGTETFDF